MTPEEVLEDVHGEIHLHSEGPDFGSFQSGVVKGALGESFPSLFLSIFPNSKYPKIIISVEPQKTGWAWGPWRVYVKLKSPHGRTATRWVHLAPQTVEWRRKVFPVPDDEEYRRILDITVENVLSLIRLAEEYRDNFGKRTLGEREAILHCQDVVREIAKGLGVPVDIEEYSSELEYNGHKFRLTKSSRKGTVNLSVFNELHDLGPREAIQAIKFLEALHRNRDP